MYIQRMLKFFFFTLMTLHLFACFWNVVSEWSHPYWYESAQIIGESNWSLYMRSVYFVITTFTSVGYGDFKPTTDIEICYVIFMHFAGFAFFAYFVGNVTAIVADLETKKNFQTIRQDKLSIWLMRLANANTLRKFPIQLSNEIEDLYKYLWCQETKFLNDFGIVSKMPFNLKKQVLNHMFDDFRQFYSQLFVHCEESFFYEFIQILVPHQFNLNDLVIAEKRPQT